MLEKYVEWKFPEEIYGKPSLEMYLMIYDSYEYKRYVLGKALTNLKDDIKKCLRLKANDWNVKIIGERIWEYDRKL